MQKTTISGWWVGVWWLPNIMIIRLSHPNLDEVGTRAELDNTRYEWEELFLTQNFIFFKQNILEIKPCLPQNFIGHSKFDITFFFNQKFVDWNFH